MTVLLLQSVASEWVDRYQESSEKAMVELVQFFVHCCGCRATITMEMFQNEETTSVIRSLTENFDEVYTVRRARCVHLLAMHRVFHKAAKRCTHLQ